MRIIVTALLCSVVGVSGCASILNGKTQKVNVTTSSNSKITGTVNGTAFTTPQTIDLPHAKKPAVFVTDTPGCAKETLVDSQVDDKFWINIIIGGGFGSSTDYSTEKMWKYNDNVVISCKK